MSMIFGYARVSSLDQNLDTQLDALQKYGCQEIFHEKITGTLTTRPALDRMLQVLRSGDTVVVARFNRLGRSRDHLINLVQEFSSKGIIFKALDLGIDTSTPTGKLMLQIFAALAEYERETILEKTKAGIELAKANGKHLGRPAGVNPMNYIKVKSAYKKGLSVLETVQLTGVSLSSVKRYRKMIAHEPA